MLAVEGLTKSFGGVVAVGDVTFVVGAGESVGLVGPNGAGKTTVFNCICGQLRPDRGDVTLDDRSLGRTPPWRRARLGIGRTFQRLELFAEMTVAEHMLVADRAHRRSGRLWRDLSNRAGPDPAERDRIAAALSLTGLADLADRPVSTLSLGTGRLVELARALVGEPRVLLADEPSSGLDGRETEEVARTLRVLQSERSMAILLVEHHLGMVEAVADRVVAMDAGRVAAVGSFDEVMASPGVRRAYLGAR